MNRGQRLGDQIENGGAEGEEVRRAWGLALRNEKAELTTSSRSRGQEVPHSESVEGSSSSSPGSLAKT